MRRALAARRRRAHAGSLSAASGTPADPTRRGPWALAAGAVLARAWRWLPLRLLPIWLRLVEPARPDLGAIGERLAARHLARRGLRVLASNDRSFGVEADLVAEDGRALVLVEVKTSRCRAELALGAVRYRPADRVRPERLERLRSAARRLAAGTGRAAARVDVVEVWVAGPRRRVTLAWHRDAREGG